jgi:hypothetical protein
MKLSLARRPTEAWKSCVQLVRQRYTASFDAEVHPNPDAFVAGYSDTISAFSKDISACAGLTFASGAPFFSERYLDDRIEDCVEQLSGVRPDRQRIVEIGQLASRHDGSGKEIIRMAPVMMWCLGMQYIMCTATTPLISIFQKMRIPFAPLQVASRDRLSTAEREQWGSYYDENPIVGVIPLDQIAPLFSDTTGRCAFADPVITLLDARTPRHGLAQETEA